MRRIDFCHTPKHGSWLNVAENELSSMTRQCLKDRRIGDLDTRLNEIAAWSTDVNQTQRGVDWQMKIDDARCKLKSIYPQGDSVVAAWALHGGSGLLVAVPDTQTERACSWAVCAFGGGFAGVLGVRRRPAGSSRG